MVAQVSTVMVLLVCQSYDWHFGHTRHMIGHMCRTYCVGAKDSSQSLLNHCIRYIITSIKLKRKCVLITLRSPA